MLMRKLLVVLGPLLLCLLCSVLFRWLDGLQAAGSFFVFVLKGLALGVAIALVLPVAGIRTHNNGLTGLLYIAAGLLALALLYQYLETVGAVHWLALRAIFSLNGQVVLIQSAMLSFAALTAALGTRAR